MSAHEARTGSDWQDHAACGADPESCLAPHRADQALGNCAPCPGREPGAADAAANDQQYGVWGGVVRGFVPAGGNRKGWSERRVG